ncbi:hypothetical protein [Mycobacteroides abscessus]|nr:hypothetical protein [Mycobacteroides abscessus]
MNEVSEVQEFNGDNVTTVLDRVVGAMQASATPLRSAASARARVSVA